VLVFRFFRRLPQCVALQVDREPIMCACWKPRCRIPRGIWANYVSLSRSACVFHFILTLNALHGTSAYPLTSCTYYEAFHKSTLLRSSLSDCLPAARSNSILGPDKDVSFRQPFAWYHPASYPIPIAGFFLREDGRSMKSQT
jgi:hypothetical protein